MKRELERDRTKTYVVEISPLGLVEMTRQNVTEGPREILTRRCPTCEGDGTILSEGSAAVDAERRLRALASESPRTKAFRVELNARVRDLLVGPGAAQLQALEDITKRRFFLESKADAPLDHFNVLDRGPLAKLQPQAAVEEGAELELKLVEVGLYDVESGVGKLNGLDIAVGGAAKLVGKKVKIRVERVLDGTAFATLAGAGKQAAAPITAEGLAEKPTRASRSRKVAEEPAAEVDEAEVEEAEVEEAEDVVDAVAEEAVDEPAEGAAEEPADAPKKKRTRRGSRGGRNRKKKPAAAVDGDAAANGEVAETAAPPKIHLPAADLGEEPSTDGDEAQTEAGAPKKKRTRRGSRGGRRRRKPAAASAVSAEPAAEAPAD